MDEQTKTSFSIMVEKVAKDHSCTYLTALAEVAEEYGIESSSINSYITRGLKEKIEYEAKQLNLFKDSNNPVSLLDI